MKEDENWQPSSIGTAEWEKKRRQKNPKLDTKLQKRGPDVVIFKYLLQNPPPRFFFFSKLDWLEGGVRQV